MARQERTERRQTHAQFMKLMKRRAKRGDGIAEGFLHEYERTRTPAERLLLIAETTDAILRVEYQEAGAPYGDDAEGVARWVREHELGVSDAA